MMEQVRKNGETSQGWRPHGDVGHSEKRMYLEESKVKGDNPSSRWRTLSPKLNL